MGRVRRALLAASAPFLKRAWRDRDPVQWIAIAVFLEILIAPRPMSYGFARLGPAPFLLAPAALRTRTGALLLATMLCAQGWFRAASLQPDSLAATYAPFLPALTLWLWAASERTRVAAPVPAAAAASA